ncbi:hypothetical protein D3C86_2033100 [compost metagenome]
MQANNVGHLTGDERPRSQAKQVVDQGQGGERGAMHLVVGQVGDHGNGGTVDARHDQHAHADQRQLRGADRQRQGQREQQATAQAQGDGNLDLAHR